MEQEEQRFNAVRQQLIKTKEAIQTVMVGQENVIDQVLWTILSQGHALLEGMPGQGKTVLIKTISEVMDLSFSRIQFTPDLMPSDITGTMMIQPDDAGRQSFTFHQGPVFSQLLLADEINRATPKTQSALLEAMAERTVTVMGTTHQLPVPFFVLATQNPVDLEGTYPLPEAQMDRFLCKVLMESPSKAHLKEMVKRTVLHERSEISKMMNGEQLLEAQRCVRQVLVGDDVLDYAIHLIAATQVDEETAPSSVKKYIQFGAGPRGLQSLIQIAKARAFMEGRYHMSTGDIDMVAHPVLRHRLLLNFEGETESLTIDDMIDDVLRATKEVVLAR
ncbi:MoxR family ATPase [Bacillaceae bacterium SIJ1]|nr:MoxR family ATPase [Litoribacterium kuwaitense]NGP44273.1 MoxR family ATPase [Litoribacterium kuwaitense]